MFPRYIFYESILIYFSYFTKSDSALYIMYKWSFGVNRKLGLRNPQVTRESVWFHFNQSKVTCMRYINCLNKLFSINKLYLSHKHNLRNFQKNIYHVKTTYIQ